MQNRIFRYMSICTINNLKQKGLWRMDRLYIEAAAKVHIWIQYHGQATQGLEWRGAGIQVTHNISRILINGKVLRGYSGREWGVLTMASCFLRWFLGSTFVFE
jgi:hypothetical protein